MVMTLAMLLLALPTSQMLDDWIVQITQQILKGLELGVRVERGSDRQTNSDSQTGGTVNI